MSDLEPIGPVVRIQVQRRKIKIKGEGYHPEWIANVDRAALVGGGMLGWDGDSWVMDVHHPLYPGGKGRANRAVSVGFTSHYQAMEERFGALADGIAGENLIVQTSRSYTPDDVAAGLVVRTAEGDIDLVEPAVARPCPEFTSHLLGLGTVADKEAIADDIAFVDEGIRGYVAAVGSGPMYLSIGDEVYRRSG
ncbi:MAG: hypothetical protein OEM94_12050 [Acidimicrobiia bacterium]|nr:hypothetical protein [Acidimicrobiia bacterium]